MSAALSAGSWPAGLGHRAVYSISAVMESLRGDFPGLTISKLRYLEDQGLVTPERTQSGYRRYSEADIERVAWVLLQQRDHFLPLRVIRDRLAAMDAAAAAGASAPSPRAPRAAVVGAAEVATLTGQELAAVEAVARAAGLPADAADASLVQAVEAVAELAEFGLDLRHLRPLFQAAERAAGLADRAVAARWGAGATERALAARAECAEALAKLSAALLRAQAVRPAPR
ncbi:MAG: MerR family transcriptional regulator [Bifidobacteriaceae bacterium]|nr:MerR family transcriptional regulator [Bifidobacteriaceae bacterium]